jgi:ubiquitin-protein ligase
MSKTNNSAITDITIDGLKYKYYCDENIQYITSSEQNKEIIDYINIFLANNKLDWSNIIMLISNYKSSNDMTRIIIDDKYNIFNINNKTKYKHKQDVLLNNFLTYCQQNKNSRKYLENIPKELFLNNKQLANMLLNEINTINNNLEYSHYIVCNDNNLMNLSIRLVYNNDLMDKFMHKHGYNYFEINIKLSDLHPYLPPIVSYIKPKIDIKLISNLLGLDIWKPSSWNYLISLEWIIINLGNALEEHFMKYIDIEDSPFNFIELKMLELQNKHENTIIILDFNKIPINNSLSTYNQGFKTGTGYGNGCENKWDISKYIDVNKTIDKNNINIINEINNYIIKSNSKNTNSDIIIPNELYTYIINKFEGINLLIFNNNIELYKVLLKTLDLININTINTNIFNIIDDIKDIVNNSIELEENYMCTYLHYIDIYEKYAKNIQINKEEKMELDENNYIKMIKENNYGTMKLDNYHRFYNERKNTISSKTIMRIMGEMSSLRKDLPINWDSSIIMRIIPTNTNLLSFIIVGPKDTPYHNGLFEFHAYFPNEYPSVVPQVLINTTDNGKVRFNPNLYSNGKVCLSLLGTWRGEKGESWIPEISTFFQVMISIQSLILVDEPYFNEPGYERTSNLPEGKKQSAIYNENIRYETIRVAMLGMLKNKPLSYEKFVEEHFRLKKDEIINIIDKWYKESINKDKFKKIIDELKIILNSL